MKLSKVGVDNAEEGGVDTLLRDSLKNSKASAAISASESVIWRKTNVN